MDGIELRRLRAEADYYAREAEALEAATPGLEAKLTRARARVSDVEQELAEHQVVIEQTKAQAAEATTKADQAEAEFGSAGGGGAALQPTVRTENG